jgi:hypothetical protein
LSASYITTAGYKRHAVTGAAEADCEQRSACIERSRPRPVETLGESWTILERTPLSRIYFGE